MEQFDKNGNYEISREELPDIIRLMGYTPTPEMIDEALHEVDKDKSGEIGFDEFVHLMRIYRVTDGFTKEEQKGLRKVFDLFDKEQDGEVSVVEMGNMLR